MRSIVSVGTAATATDLTTLERVKAELGITDDSDNTLLEAKITEASSVIKAHLGFMLARETVTETFRPDSGEEAPERLILNRVPVSSITSAAEDGTTVASTEYEYESNAGFLYRLDSSGYRSMWVAGKSIVVVYVAGWIMPGQSGENLEPAIEGAAIALIRSYWLGRRRDPMVKEIAIPGVETKSYWVGGVGDPGELPPDVVSMLSPFQRVSV